MYRLENTYKDKTVLITGHTGFKGSWLSVWLDSLGAHVYGLSDCIPTQPSHFDSLQNCKINHYEANICDQVDVEEYVNKVKPDFVFHLAAQAIVSNSISDPVYTIQTNAIGTANLLNAIRKLENSCSGIFITSDKCYENIESYYGYREIDALGGKDPYSASKAAAECIIHAFWLSYFFDSNKTIASARAGNVVGGGDWAKDRLIPDLVRAWQNNVPMICRKPAATRPWQHVLEPLSGYLILGSYLAENKYAGESFNFGPRSEDVYSVHQVIESLGSHFSELNIEYLQNTEIHDAQLLKLNCDKALDKLKWRPVLTFSETINMTASWYKSYYANDQDIYKLTSGQIDQYCKLAEDRGLNWIKN